MKGKHTFLTNNMTVEIQIMRKFMTSGILGNMQYHLPEEYRYFFLQGCRNQIDSKGTCPSVDNVLPLHLMMASCGPFIEKESVWGDLTLISFESTYLGSLDRNELGSLRSVYMTLYPKVTEASLNLATLYKKYKSLSVGGERYGSTAGFRLCPYAHIIASWCGDNGGINPGMQRPGIIRHFIVHSVEIDGKQAIHAFVIVNWLRLSEQDFGNPLSVWYARNFEDSGPAEFIQNFYLLLSCILDSNTSFAHLFVGEFCYNFNRYCTLLALPM